VQQILRDHAIHLDTVLHSSRHRAVSQAYAACGTDIYYITGTCREVCGSSSSTVR
jgi:hypothetical protein